MTGMGYRTIKTVVGAGLAIWIVSLSNLEFATFAGIIVIMCIERTKKKTLITMKDKFFASLLSLILGAIAFEIVGYHPIVFSLFILLFIPILMKIKIQGGFVTSMVVVLHIYTLQDFNMEIFFNELYIIAIGMGIALLVNSIMPSLKKDIEAYKRQIEQKFSVILYEFSAYLRDTERNWHGNEIMEAEDIINQSKNIAIRDVENNLLQGKDKDYIIIWKCARINWYY